MKKGLLLCFVIYSMGCNSQTMRNTNPIVGNWLIIVMNGLQCNVCPKIEFLKNGKGTITKPSNEKVTFTYTFVANNTIKFSFKGSQLFFDQQEYIYKIYTENKIEMLELSSEDKKSRYILSRE